MGLFTIGHSNHNIATFLQLLSMHRISAVADVRSQPNSRHYPHFASTALKRSLRSRDIAYVFLGDELGARSADPRCYEGRRVSYARLAEAPAFAQGIKRLEAGSVSERIAIMCAEGEPLDCHRTVLLSPALIDRDHPVTHIHRDGALEEHEKAMRRLRTQWGLLDADLFHDDDELTAKALLRQESKIAFVADDEWAEKIGIL